MPRHCYVLRVFTDGDAGGNHLGVVTDVTGLDPHAMQRIAAELGFSETIFVDWRQGGIPEVRIFTPTRELPFAGHPLVGAGWVLTELGPGSPDRIRCPIGEVGLRREYETVWIDTPLDQAVETAQDGAELAAHLDLPPPAAAAWVRMPLPYLLLELASPREVAAALTPRGTGPMVYLYAWEDRAAVKARFFAPGVGVPEDPATGSAAVALAARLRAAGRPSGAIEIHQGAEVGFPSTIRLRWDAGGAAIGGTVRRDEVRELPT